MHLTRPTFWRGWRIYVFIFFGLFAELVNPQARALGWANQVGPHPGAACALPFGAFDLSNTADMFRFAASLRPAAPRSSSACLSGAARLRRTSNLLLDSNRSCVVVGTGSGVGSSGNSCIGGPPATTASAPTSGCASRGPLPVAGHLGLFMRSIFPRSLDAGLPSLIENRFNEPLLFGD